MSHLPALPPLSLYIHVPWCVQKCPYCDFNSHQQPRELPETQYIDALLADLEQDLSGVQGRALGSIFIGGGTPSLLQPASLDRLLQGVRERIGCDPDLEITLEANPGTAEAGRFREYAALGINRLSLGIQSFDDRFLQALGRIHSAAEARAAVHMAQAAGFGRLNLDLMFGLPGQDRAQCLADLRAATDLQPGHLSWYQLTLEPNTLFAARPPALPDEDEVWEMHCAGQEHLAVNGYARYEISAYGYDHQCRHNLNYWAFGDYLGIGAGAHGKLTQPSPFIVQRTRRARHPQAYLERAGRGDQAITRSTVPAQELTFEFLLNSLRLCHGFERTQFEAHTSLPFDRLLPRLQGPVELGLLQVQDDRVIPTEFGLRYLNNLLESFLEEAEPRGEEASL